MEVLKITMYAVLGLMGLIVCICAGIRALVYYADRAAIKMARDYCRHNGYRFRKVQVFSCHYGLHYSKGNKYYYSGFYIGNKGTIVFKKDAPEEIIEELIPQNINYVIPEALDGSLKSVG